MAFFGRNWLEDTERDEIGPLSHWDEDLEDLDFLDGGFFHRYKEEETKNKK